MSENLKRAKSVAEKMLDLNYEWIDAQSVLTEQEERQFIDWQNQNSKWVELPNKILEIRLKKMQIKPNNNQ